MISNGLINLKFNKDYDLGIYPVSKGTLLSYIKRTQQTFIQRTTICGSHNELSYVRFAAKKLKFVTELKQYYFIFVLKALQVKKVIAQYNI